MKVTGFAEVNAGLVSGLSMLRLRARLQQLHASAKVGRAHYACE